MGIVGFRGIGMVGDSARKWFRYKVFRGFVEKSPRGSSVGFERI